VLKRFIVLPENPKPERTGGYLAVFETKKIPKIGGGYGYIQWPITVTEIGICPPDMSKTFGICQEKLTRIHKHLPNGHISS